MARLFISLSGDGRGHATRARVWWKVCVSHTRWVIDTSGQGYDFLSRCYAGSNVQVRSIPGLRFGYGAAGNVSMGRSLAGAIQYLLGLPQLLARLRVSLAVEQPDLVISDFEPALPRAARQMGIRTSA